MHDELRLDSSRIGISFIPVPVLARWCTTGGDFGQLRRRSGTWPVSLAVSTWG